MWSPSLAVVAASIALSPQALTAPQEQAAPSMSGPQKVHWQGELLLDGDDALFGSLPFNLEREGDAVWIVNGDERIEVPEVEWTKDRVELGFPHFDSVLEGTRVLHKTRWVYQGTWRKQRRGEEVAVVPFQLQSRPLRFSALGGLPADSAWVEGRWRVDFESGDTPAVGVFGPLDAELDALHGAHGHGDGLVGTFLTNTGDYRFLEGRIYADQDPASGRQARLALSCFDGAHAFLFSATLSATDEAQRLDGTFHSGNWWSETWSAVRDEQIALPDPYAELELKQTTRVAETLALRPDGTEISLAELWAGRAEPPKAMVVQVLGTWCPNCYDETNLLKELHAKYSDAGLSVVGLCFELTGDIERDLSQIERYQRTRQVPYPLLWAGEANKRDTAEALGLTDRILSYPTTLFIDALGNIDAVHSGFVGPAAVEEHAELRADFEQRIESLLTRYAPDRLATEIEGTTWVSPRYDAALGSHELTLRGSGRAGLVLDEVVGFCGQSWQAELRGSVVRSSLDSFLYHPGGYLQGLRYLGRLWPMGSLAEAKAETSAVASALADAAASPGARLDALRLLADLWRAESLAIDAKLLAAALVDSDPALRIEAFDALASGSPDLLTENLEALTSALGSSNPRLRASAAAAAAWAWRQGLELPESIKVRLSAIATSDPFPSVRRAAD